jgi:SnoaL-like domain
MTGNTKPAGSAASDSSSSKSKGKAKAAEAKSNIGFSSMFQMQSSVQDDVSKSDDDKEDESVYGVKSVCSASAMSYTGDSSSDASMGGSTQPSSVPPSATALKVLRGYYDAFNNHNIPAAVAYLANDIQVTFPDPKKNWSSAAAAYDRYTTMFRKSPHLKGKFSLLDVSHEHKRTAITVYCHFTCAPSGVNTVREMVYIMEDDLIQIINNKY